MGRLFGTNGVRGVVGRDMNPDLAVRLGRCLAAHVGPGKRVALGMDARTSSPLLGDAVAAGLMAGGVHVVDIGVLASPAAQFYVKTHGDVAAGVIVTASHNPPEFNGIKFVSGDGTEMSGAEEEAVETIYFDAKHEDAVWDAVGSRARDDGANAAYMNAVLGNVDAQAVAGRGWRVVLDTAGGAGGVASPEILRRLGCRVTTLFEALDGTFSGRPSEPVEANLSKLIETVQESKADLGVAHDGDADRCVFVDDRARFVPGDKVLALLAREAVAANGGGLVCTPVSSSSLVESLVEEADGSVLRTAVGSPTVARAMLEHKAVFGGEENGGLIFPEMQHCRDAAMTMAAVLDFLTRTRRSLSDWVDELPQFHQVKTSVPCPNDAKAALTRRMREHFGSLDGVDVDQTDGIKVTYADGTWVLARPSGTEPIFRVFVEARDKERAQDLADEFVGRAKQWAGD